MSVRDWTYAIVVVSFALYIGIAIWAKAKTTKDFYVAGADERSLLPRHGGHHRFRGL